MGEVNTNISDIRIIVKPNAAAKRFPYDGIIVKSFILKRFVSFIRGLNFGLIKARKMKSTNRKDRVKNIIHGGNKTDKRLIAKTKIAVTLTLFSDICFGYII